MRFLSKALSKVQSSLSGVREQGEISEGEVGSRAQINSLFNASKRHEISAELLAEMKKLRKDNDALRRSLSYTMADLNSAREKLTERENAIDRAEKKIDRLKSNLAIKTHEAQTYKTKALQAQDLILEEEEFDIKIIYGEEYVDVFEAAKLLKVSPKVMRNIIRDKKPYSLKDFKSFYNKRVFLLDEIKNIAASRYSSKPGISSSYSTPILEEEYDSFGLGMLN